MTAIRRKPGLGIREGFTVEARPTRKQLVLLSTLQLPLLCPFALEQLKGRLAAPQPPSGPTVPPRTWPPTKESLWN